MKAFVINSKQNQYTTKDGELRQIATLTILQEFPEGLQGHYGFDVFEVNIPYHDKDNHKQLPAVYDIDLGMSHAYNKIVPVFQKLQHIKPINLLPLLDTKPTEVKAA